MRYELNRRLIEEALYRADFDIAGEDEYSSGAIREDYSGRAMYGETCFGIVYDELSQLLRFIAEIPVAAQNLGLDDEDSNVIDTIEMDWLRSARTDNMGLSMIVYFPGCTLDGTEVQS